MKEYCIYIRHGSACPFRTSTYSTFDSAKQALLIMTQDFAERNRVFYIDNEFYENKFPLGLQGCTYYQIQEREVFDWEKYNIKNTNEIKYDCKILKFQKKSIDF